MQIASTEVNGVTLIRVEGRMDAPAAPEAEDAFREVIDAGATRVVLDLSGVEYISSGGLRVIIMLMKSLEKARGRLIICNPSPFVSEVFEITHLSRRIPIYPNQEEALTAAAT